MSTRNKKAVQKVRVPIETVPPDLKTVRVKEDTPLTAVALYLTSAGAAALGIYGLLFDASGWLSLLSPHFVVFGAFGALSTALRPRITVEVGKIRYFSNRAGLRFGFPRLAIRILVVAFGLFALTTTLTIVAFAFNHFTTLGAEAFWGFPRTGWVIIFVLGPTSIYTIVRFVRELRLPSGFLIDADGAKLVSRGSWRSVKWREIRKVTQRKGAFQLDYVELHLTNGKSLEVGSYSIGSDPNVVAAIVRFYHEHPEHRDALETPQEALRRFRQHVP